MFEAEGSSGSGGMSDQEGDVVNEAEAEAGVVDEAEAGVVDEAGADLVSLSAGDIPGAELTEPLDKHPVAALRWWLLCRGIKIPTSVRKKDLIHRLAIPVGVIIL